MVLDLRSDLFAHVQRLSLTFHDQRQTGALMSQINIQAAAVGDDRDGRSRRSPRRCLTLVGMLVIAALIDWQLALALAGRGAVALLVLRRLRQADRAAAAAGAAARVAVALDRPRGDVDAAGDRLLRPRGPRAPPVPRAGQIAVDERVKLTVSQSLYTLGVQTATAAGTSLVLGVRRLARDAGQDLGRRADRR